MSAENAIGSVVPVWGAAPADDGGAIVVPTINLAYSANPTIDIASANNFIIAPITGNITLDWSNLAEGLQGEIELVQDGVGGHTLTVDPPPAGSLLRTYDAAGDPVLLEFPDTSPGARVTLYYKALSATLLRVTPVQSGV